MGTVQFGAPKESILYLRDAMGLTTLVEGGTYQGGTAKWAAGCFDQVFTIENSPEMYRIAEQNLSGISNITMLQGDSRQHLPTIVSKNDNMIYWLDAHWSGGVTYGQDDECPLLEELEIVFASERNHVVLIDDARLFLAPPPSPHRRENWPTLLEITRALPDGWDCLCHDDVLAITPNSIQAEYRDFMQRQITESAKEQKVAKPNMLRRLRDKVTS
ncbi:hypothetical protein LF1_35270 [Rubripirellula obstinata]|uniref:Class I SAM-dependent methyltransferase n=1 Tax=Rubripirellula obstinata TaxID=406547 RepID=A0A5B1CM59_9BACT|nr:hypothetical protein [Rubripirellula obstinata]KAA1260985.1 hypothetical protein LF1_35270 [Rubripirellula obstinata]